MVEQDSTKFLLLKIFVYCMALVLVGGFMYVGAEVYERINAKEEIELVPVAKKGGYHHKYCEGKNVEVQAGADVVSVEMGKRTVSILTEAKGNEPQKIIIMDYCDGRVISEIVVR